MLRRLRQRGLITKHKKSGNMRIKSSRLGPGAFLTGALLLSGCGTLPATAVAARPSPSYRAPTTAMTLITEPQDGFVPWQQALAQAKTGVDVNEYLLTDRTYVHDLIRLAATGIPVHVILDGRPYEDSAAVSQEQAAFTGTKVQLHWAPARFEGAYAFDHAKYLVINPGTPHALAIFGSANGTYSAFAGFNAEDDIETTEPAITTALSEVFQADWTNHPAGSVPRQTLVLSPGSQFAFNTLLTTNKPVAVMTEELGSDSDAYHALETAGPLARVLLPYPTHETVHEQDVIESLLVKGVQVRFLRQPYVHAKLIVTAKQTFVGSQNLSFTSMKNNREVGLITGNPTVHAEALAWFNNLWAQAQPAS